MNKSRRKRTMRTWEVDWCGQKFLVVAESWWRALLIVGKQFPFDPSRDM